MSKDATYKKLIQSPEWRKLRNAQLEAHPLCARCQEQGIVRAARCVHHITPVESARDTETARVLCYSWSNLQSLCYACHAEIHKAEKSHSKDAHKQRQADALERWKEQHRLKGGGFFY